MFTIHLTPTRYIACVTAAQFDEGKRDPDHLHISFESEPNVSIGDEVEVIVSDGKQETRQIGTVVRIKPPVEKQPWSDEEERNHDEQMRQAAMQIKAATGIDPSAFPKDES